MTTPARTARPRSEFAQESSTNLGAGGIGFANLQGASSRCLLCQPAGVYGSINSAIAGTQPRIVLPLLHRYEFTLHGMWPQRRDGTWPEYCDPSSHIDMDALDDLVDEMEHDWPSWSSTDEVRGAHSGMLSASTAPALRSVGDSKQPSGGVLVAAADARASLSQLLRRRSGTTSGTATARAPRR
jgi:hypothetical protein